MTRSDRPVDWEELLTKNENRLYRAALAILGDVHEAQDAVQDAFMRFLEKAPDDLENPGAWLMRVLVKYSCNGLTAQQVWELVEPTLKNND